MEDPELEFVRLLLEPLIALAVLAALAVIIGAAFTAFTERRTARPDDDELAEEIGFTDASDAAHDPAPSTHHVASDGATLDDDMYDTGEVKRRRWFGR